MKSTLTISGKTRILRFALASVFVTNILLGFCPGEGYGAGGGYGGGMSTVPDAFTLVSPPNAAPNDPMHTLLTVTPTLTWTQAIGATGYIVQISKTADFASPVLTVNVGPMSTSYTVTAGQALQSGTPYYWRVIAYIIYTQQITATNAPFTFTPQ